MINDQFEIVYFAPVILASSESEMRASDIPAQITRMFGQVYDWLATTGIDPCGHNHALYDQVTNAGLRMRVGVPVSAEFESTASITCLQFAGGRAAHTRHRGSYSQLYETQLQLRAWRRQKSAEAAGLSWEVYGDWSDAIDNLVTDVYILLK